MQEPGRGGPSTFVPFISGKQDWGTYQRPGVYEAMQSKACTSMIGCPLVEAPAIGCSRSSPRK